MQRRLSGLTAIVLLVLLSGCTLRVPNVPRAPESGLAENAPVVFISILIVIVVDALVIWATLRRQSQ